MVDIKNNINKSYDSNHESRTRINSSDTVPSTPSSSSDYMTGEADEGSTKLHEKCFYKCKSFV